MTYKLHDSFGYLMAKATLLMNNVFQKKLNKFDITRSQAIALTAIWEENGATPTDLAEITGRDIPNVLRILDKLEKKELIYRKACEIDKRSYMVYLTSKGLELREKIIPLAEEMAVETLADFDPEAIEQMKAGFRKVIRNIEK